MPFDRELVEAQLALGQIDANGMVALAIEALEAGLDGPAIRRMAALTQPSGWEVDQHLPSFMLNAHLQAIPGSEASIRLALQLAEDILRSKSDPLPHVKRFERLWIDSDYSQAIQRLGSLDDEIEIGFLGNSEDEIRQTVLKRLWEFTRDNKRIEYSR